MLLIYPIIPTDLTGQSTMTLRKFALIGLLLPVAAYAQHAEHQQHPNTDHQGQHTSSLSADDITGLQEGRGMGMARPAELNGYPGPLHVLELADALGLTMDQRMEAQRLREALLAKAQPLGAQIVERERRLDMMFVQQRADREMIEAATAEIGLLRAQLRAVHLNAHVGMYAAMTSGQRTRYTNLRGHEGPAMQPHDGMLDNEASPEDMDHGDMDHGDMDHDGMDHGDMDNDGMDHSGMDHGGMDHEDAEPTTLTHDGHQN
ncbi:MAG: periplasmic heavy metal sensor [Bacteroidetes bacterium]|nr:periplasmic heavy metal sensor [Bacteroidota bacterium]